MLLKTLKSAFSSRVAYSENIQGQADVAVCVQTVLRPSLERAVASIFSQEFAGTIQIIICIDKYLGDVGLLKRLRKQCPRNMAVTLIDLGYSTSIRHGGVYSNNFGGAMRTVGSYAANSRWIAYLDDDDWYGPTHLSQLKRAVLGRAWAFSKRWWVSPYSLRPMCIDALENLGPTAGLYADSGGFACPSTLILDKLECHHALPYWAIASSPHGDGEDRSLFAQLPKGIDRFGATDEATAYCVAKPEDSMHSARQKALQDVGYDLEPPPNSSSEHRFKRI